MLKVTSDGIQKLGEDIVLSEDDLEEIGNMFDQYSRGVVFPEKQEVCDGQTPIYLREQEVEEEARVKELVKNYDRD